MVLYCNNHALWCYIALNSGTDRNKARRKAILSYTIKCNLTFLSFQNISDLQSACNTVKVWRHWMSVSLKPKSDSMLIRLLPAAVKSIQGSLKMCRIYFTIKFDSSMFPHKRGILYPLCSSQHSSLKIYIHTQPFQCPPCCCEMLLYF